jgi:AcrR family transcriptional regulator
MIGRVDLEELLRTMPADSRLTRERLLLTATRLFAEHGYEGVSLRNIARAAKTHLALIHYHFGSKEDLYRAIWASRYGAPIEWRLRMFSTIDYSLPRQELVEQLVDIFLRPVVDLMEDPDGRAFLRIMAYEMGDSKEPQRGVLNEYLDPTGRAVIGAFRRALPEVSPADIAWGFQAMAGATMLHMVEVDRISRMSDRTAISGDVASAYPRLRAFMAGGWLEIARLYERFPSQIGVFPWRVDGEPPLVVWAPDKSIAPPASRAERLQSRGKTHRTSGRTRARAKGRKRRLEA